MAFELGQTYSDYQFIDIVESSRTGVTYKVRNLAENRFEHLKVLPKALQEDPERVERFFREAKVRSRLAHPKIVSFYNATVLDGQFVMTTELVEGRTAAERLELGPMEVEEAVRLAIQALQALDYAHQHGVVHRDVSPGNLLVNGDGSVQLSGFSFARAATDPRLTQVGAMLGEVHYMSPEQVRGVDEPDARSDVYSLGVVLYEMLTGRRPFESTSQFEIMMAHVSSMPAPPSQLNRRLPTELDAVVLTAMAKDPDRRFQSASLFLEALQAPRAALRQPEPLQPHPVEVEPRAAPAATPPPAPAPPPAAFDRHPSIAARAEAPVLTQAATAAIPAAMMPASPAASDLPELRIGPREMLVLALGIMLMIASVLMLAR